MGAFFRLESLFLPKKRWFKSKTFIVFYPFLAVRRSQAAALGTAFVIFWSLVVQAVIKALQHSAEHCSAFLSVAKHPIIVA